MARKKIALIGAGMIGGTLAHLAAMRELGDIVLFDVVEGVPQGKALDIAQARPGRRLRREVEGHQRLCRHRGRRRVHRHRRRARKPGMSRDDLLGINLKVMKAVGEGIKATRPNAFVICITNPLDAMVWALREFSGLPHKMVVGMAGVLDSARFRHFLAEEFDVSRRGRHHLRAGRPWRHHGADGPTIRPSPASRSRPRQDGLDDQDRIDAIVKRTRGGGGEIVALLEDRLGLLRARRPAAIAMAEAYLKDKKRVLPAPPTLDGQIRRRRPLCRRAGGHRRRRGRADRRDRTGCAGPENFKSSVDAVKELLEGLQADRQRARPRGRRVRILVDANKVITQA